MRKFVINVEKSAVCFNKLLRSRCTENLVAGTANDLKKSG